MGVHRLRGPTVRDALRAVERELGAGALIVETRAVPGGFEIAAVPGPRRRPAPASGVCPAFAALAARGRRFGLPDALLRNVDAALRAEGLAHADPDARAVARAAAAALGRLLPAARLGPETRATALVGPAGAGKTSTIAKLATRAAHNRRPLGLASLDVDRPGATAALEDHAAALGLAFARLRDVAALGSFLAADRSAPHLLVDTPGAAAADRADLESLAALAADRGIRCVLCLPATVRRDDALRIVDRFAPLRPAAAVVTRWDETATAGDVLGVLAERNLPLTFVGTGPGIPDDLVDADPTALAACAFGLDEELVGELLA